MRKYVFEFSIDLLYFGVITFIAIAVLFNFDKEIGPSKVFLLVGAIAVGAGLRTSLPLKNALTRFLLNPRIGALFVIAVFYGCVVAFRPISTLLYASIITVVIGSMLRLSSEEKRRRKI